MRMSAKNQGPLTNDTTFGFALSIVLALISSIWGTVSPFDPYLFWQKAAFQHFDETKKDAVSLMGRSARGSCPALGKGGFFRACPGRLSIQHNGIFICFYQTAFPGVRLRMDKGIIANFSGAFIKFVMICMVCVMKCLACQRPAMPPGRPGSARPCSFCAGNPKRPRGQVRGGVWGLCFAIGAGDQTVSMPAICLMALMAKVRVRPQAVPPMTQG